MTTYGVTPTGFVLKPQSVILSEIQQAYETAFGVPQAAQTGDTVLGQLAGIHSERESQLWMLAQDVLNATFPDTSEGVNLVNVGQIVNKTPYTATFSTGTVTLIGTANTVVDAGNLLAVTGTGDRFATTAGATIAALTSWASGTGYTVGQQVTNSGNVYQCITAGTAAGSGGPTTTAADITDNSVHWKYLGAGTAAANVTVQAQALGAIVAPAGTLTTIATPVAGLASVTNAADIAVGRAAETDAQFRARRALELSETQGGTIAAMEARIKDGVAGVTFCAVEENRLDVAVGSLPPHSVHVTVIGGTDADVAAKIWKTKPAGANTVGSYSATVVDSYGNNQTVYWDRATTVRMYYAVHRTTDSTYPTDGDTLIKNAIVAYGATLRNGDSAINWKAVAALAGIPGIVTLTIYQGTSPGPSSSANTTTAANAVATIAAADITVGT